MNIKGYDKGQRLLTALFRELSVGARKQAGFKHITFQPALRKEASSFARICNPLQVTTNVSLFWWYIKTLL